MRRTYQGVPCTHIFLGEGETPLGPGREFQVACALFPPARPHFLYEKRGHPL
jgi:hypothetical protein